MKKLRHNEMKWLAENTTEVHGKVRTKLWLPHSSQDSPSLWSRGNSLSLTCTQLHMLYTPVCRNFTGLRSSATQQVFCGFFNPCAVHKPGTISSLWVVLIQRYSWRLAQMVLRRDVHCIKTQKMHLHFLFWSVYLYEKYCGDRSKCSDCYSPSHGDLQLWIYVWLKDCSDCLACMVITTGSPQYPFSMAKPLHFKQFHEHTKWQLKTSCKI